MNNLNSKPILELKNVSKFYDISRNVKEFFTGIKPLVKAVENVSFKIFSGETVGVLGESGCGKTTLGKLILNLLEPSNGNIYFLSKDIHNYEGKQIKEFKKMFN